VQACEAGVVVVVGAGVVVVGSSVVVVNKSHIGAVPVQLSVSGSYVSPLAKVS
jgi:hypothetical protein